MGQTPSTMKPHKTGRVWKHLTEIKNALIAEEDCAQLGRGTTSEPSLSSLFPLYLLPKKHSSTHNTKDEAVLHPTSLGNRVAYNMGE